MRNRSSSGQSAFVWADDKPQFEATDEQRQAIEHVHGPMLVVAGAGTGKTTVLTQRIARLLKTGAAKPHEVLAVTYTRNSAHDLVKRLASAWLGRGDEAGMRQVLDAGVKVGTFHAYCYSILCRAGRRFELVDDQDQYVLLRRNIEELGLEHFITAGNLGKFLKDLLDFFRRCSDELRGPGDYDEYVARLVRGEIPLPRVCHSKQMLSDDEVIGRCREIARVFRQVTDKFNSAGLGTYGDVISQAIDLLSDEKTKVHLERARRGARFTLIDEFQDSNVAQIKLAKLLGGEEANVFAVGDPDQAIYRFRGATSGAFDQFLAAFGVDRVKRATMSANRRSTESILRSAHAAIAENPQITRLVLPGGTAWTRQPLIHARTKPEAIPAPPVHVSGYRDKVDEAAFVADEIERLQEAGRQWRDFVVLYRIGFHRGEVIARLRERDIPFVVKGADVLETSEVRDLMAALRALQLSDAVGLLRVAALPCFSVDGAELRTMLAAAGKEPEIEKVLELLANGGEVVTALAEARHQLQAANGSAVAAMAIAQRCFELPSNENCDDFIEFVERWAKKPQAIVGEATLREFLEYLELFAEAGGKVCKPEDDDEGTPATLQMESAGEKQGKPEKDAVHLMTVHAAKGLEFPVVFVIRFAGNSFPAKYKEDLVNFPNELRNRENIPEGDPESLHKEEERRLFYVAMTRAEDRLILCGKVSGKKDPTPAGYLRGLLNHRSKQLAGAIEYQELPEGTLISMLRASAAAQPRILDWVWLPPLDSSRRLQLSPSAIERYDACPLRFKLHRDWNLPEEPGAAMQYGAAMHSALMGYFDAVRKGRNIEPDAVVASFLDEFAKAKIEEPLQRELYERNGRRQLLAFLGSGAAVPRGEVKMVEYRIKLEVAGAEVTGRIDRVDEDEHGLTIIDYKTGRPKSQELADKSLQLSVYALALKKQGPVKAVIFENLEDSSTVETTRDAGDLKKAEDKIAEVARRIMAGDFEPKPGLQCSWCAYRMVCPAKELVTIEGSATRDVVH